METDSRGVMTDEEHRERKEHGTAQFPAAVYDDDLARTYVAYHWHEEWEISFVEEGGAVATVNGERHEIRPGSGYFLNAGALHTIRGAKEGPGRLRAIVFHPRIVGGSLDSVYWQSYVQPILEDMRSIFFDGTEQWHTEAVRLIKCGWYACTEGKPGYELEVRDALSRLCMLLREHCGQTEQKAPSRKALRNAKRMKLMLEFVALHYDETIKVKDIARSAAVSVSECLRCFRATIRTSPNTYLRQYRIGKAAELLSGTDEKIGDIAMQCGFPDLNYFCRTFKQMAGCSPGEYRKRKAPKPAKNADGQNDGKRASFTT